MRVQPVLRLLAECAVALAKNILEAGCQVSLRQLNGPAADLAVVGRLKRKELLRALGQPFLRAEGAEAEEAQIHHLFGNLAQLCKVIRRDGQLLVGVKRVVVRRMVQPVGLDGPGVLDVCHQPVIALRIAPAAAAQVADKVVLVLDVDGHIGDDIQRHIDLLQHGRKARVELQRLQLQGILLRVSHDHPITYGSAHPLDARQNGSKFIHR